MLHCTASNKFILPIILSYAHPLGKGKHIDRTNMTPIITTTIDVVVVDDSVNSDDSGPSFYDSCFVQRIVQFVVSEFNHQQHKEEGGGGGGGRRRMFVQRMDQAVPGENNDGSQDTYEFVAFILWCT